VSEITIKNVLPRAALPGGEVTIEYEGPQLVGNSQPEVRFGDFSAQVTLASNDRLVARVPEPSAETGTSELRIAYSGRRGQKTPVSIYKITPKGAVTPFVTDIVNATGLAFSLSGDLYVSSRLEGNVYRVDPKGRTETYIEGMGIATGIAFDHEGYLYVGDRSGSIFKISPGREIFVFATLEPSIAAYHLAFGFDDYLYVSGPTTSSFDSIYRISPSGEVSRFFTGLGRPQGLAFDIDGHLYAVASNRGRRGIFRFRDPKRPELVVAGLSLVGLAFDLKENLMVVDLGPQSGSLYRVHLGITGKPLP
jgi:hypothetical protein